MVKLLHPEAAFAKLISLFKAGMNGGSLQVISDNQYKKVKLRR